MAIYVADFEGCFQRLLDRGEIESKSTDSPLDSPFDSPANILNPDFELFNRSLLLHFLIHLQFKIFEFWLQPQLLSPLGADLK